MNYTRLKQMYGPLNCFLESTCDIQTIPRIEDKKDRKD